MDRVVAPGGSRSFLAWRRHNALEAGTPCYNCGSRLVGPWCHDCGQAGEDFHRHALPLLAEAFENFFHADGRLLHTLPRLVVNPARLTRDYLAGKRASQIPPLRLFLVALLILFVVGSWAAGPLHIGQIDPHDAATAQAAFAQTKLDLGLPGHWNDTLADWLHDRVGRAIAHPAELVQSIQPRAHTFAFLMLPVAAAILSAIFFFRRGVVLFDHLVFSMHSLAFQGLLLSIMVLASGPLGPMAKVLLWLAPLHLFAHMHGVYGTGVVGTLVRMAVLFIASVVGFSLLLGTLVLLGLQGLAA